MEIATALIGLIAMVAGALGYAISRRVTEEASRVAGESPQERADRLSQALREAVEVIEEFQTEIIQGQETAMRLQKDIDEYEELARLHRDEVEAVARVLRTEIREESGRSFRRDLAMNGAFLLIGAGLSLLLTSIFG